MRTLVVMLVTFAAGLGAGSWMTSAPQTAPAAASAAGFAALPGAIGSEDLTGPYEVVQGWPKDISTLPGNEKWTYGAGQGVFAESPNRIFMLFRGELPNIAAPRQTLFPQLGPSISFPSAGLWRDATTASFPASAARIRTQEVADGLGGQGRRARDQGSALPQAGRRREWENCIVVADGNGNIIERGPSGTRSSSVRTPSISTRTIPRSTSGSSTTTCR